MIGEKKWNRVLNRLQRTLDFDQFFLNWLHCAKQHQSTPDNIDWLIWLLLGGRGAGKTRTGAEWIRSQVADHGKRRIALVAPTFQDAREVMIEGESGLHLSLVTTPSGMAQWCGWSCLF